MDVIQILHTSMHGLHTEVWTPYYSRMNCMDVMPHVRGMDLYESVRLQTKPGILHMQRPRYQMRVASHTGTLPWAGGWKGDDVSPQKVSNKRSCLFGIQVDGELMGILHHFVFKNKRIFKREGYNPSPTLATRISQHWCAPHLNWLVWPHDWSHADAEMPYKSMDQTQGVWIRHKGYGSKTKAWILQGRILLNHWWIVRWEDHMRE